MTTVPFSPKQIAVFISLAVLVSVLAGVWAGLYPVSRSYDKGFRDGAFKQSVLDAFTPCEDLAPIITEHL